MIPIFRDNFFILYYIGNKKTKFFYDKIIYTTQLTDFVSNYI